MSFKTKILWIESEKTFNRQIAQLKSQLAAIKSPIKQILLSILEQLKALTEKIGGISR